MKATLHAPSRRFQAVALATTGFLTFGVLSAVSPAQDTGRPTTPQTGEPRARTAPTTASGDLAASLTQLHQEFDQRFREALRGAQDERFANTGQDAIVTMLGSDRVIAGFQTTGASGAARPTEPGGMRAGETPGARGAGRQGGDTDTGLPTAPESELQGEEVLGVIVIGGQATGASTRPVEAGTPRRVGEDPEARRVTPGGETGMPNARSIAPGVYEVRWMGGDLIALVDQDGSPVLGTTVYDGNVLDANLGREREGEGMEPPRGAGERGGVNERGGIDQRPGDAGELGRTPGMAQGMSDRPAWPRVYLAIVREIASSSITGR